MSGTDPVGRERTAASPAGGRDIGPRAALALLLLLSVDARADAPLPPPADREVRSPNGRCSARAEAAARRVVVGGRDPDGRAVSWIVPGWHRAILVGDDCRTLGVGYPGGNLLDLADREPGTPVLTFLREDGPARVVRLGELYTDLAVLPRTASHLSWRSGEGWDGHRWSVRTVDGRVLGFGP